jgi:hypothetical protein
MRAIRRTEWIDMTKWFYRAVGTVGVAGGFLLLAGGVAQADDAATTPVNDLQGSLDGFFTPMGPSSLAGGADPAAPLNGLANLSLGGKAVNPTDSLGLLGALPLDPTATLAPGGTGAAPGGLGGGPLGAVTGALGSAPAAAPATEAGGGLPVLGSLPQFGAIPTDAVRNLNPTQLPSVQNFDAGKLLPALIGDNLAAQSPELFTESSPLASIPLVGDVMLAGALAPPPAAGAPADAPVDAPADVPAGAPAGAPAGGGGALGGLPLLGSLGGLTGGGAAPAGPTTLPADAPAPKPAAPAAKPAAPVKASGPSISPTSDNARGVGRHRAMSHSPTERPVAGEDADFAESTRVEALEMPALNLPLPVVGNLGQLGGLLGGGAAPADPATAPAPSDMGFDPNGGPVSRMDV